MMNTENGNRGSLILVHWHEGEWGALAAPFIAAGWAVTLLEQAAGLKFKDPPASRPAAVLISLRRLPSHGWEVAEALWQPQWARKALRIIFFDGTPAAVDTTRARFPRAIFCRFEEIAALLNPADSGNS